MTVQIIEATIHQLDKLAQTHGDDSVTLKPRETNLPLNDVLTRLCDDLIHMYGKLANSNGTLGVDPIAHKFPVQLHAYEAQMLGFLAFTKAAIELIADEMGSV
jgi:nucleoid-associated protein